LLINIIVSLEECGIIDLWYYSLFKTRRSRMSGGVDSSVAAYAQRQGYQVQGVFMKTGRMNLLWMPAAVDMADDKPSVNVLASRCMPWIFQNLLDKVFEYFYRNIKRENTKPRYFMHQEIKFKAFLDYALGLGADYMPQGTMPLY